MKALALTVLLLFAATAQAQSGMRKDPFFLPMTVVAKIGTHRFEFTTEGSLTGVMHHVLDDQARKVSQSGFQSHCVQLVKLTDVPFQNGFTGKMYLYKSLPDEKCDKDGDVHSLMITVARDFCLCLADGAKAREQVKVEPQIMKLSTLSPESQKAYHDYAAAIEGIERPCVVEAEKAFKEKGLGFTWQNFEDRGEVFDYWTCPVPETKVWDRYWSSWDFNVRSEGSSGHQRMSEYWAEQWRIANGYARKQ